MGFAKYLRKRDRVLLACTLNSRRMSVPILVGQSRDASAIEFIVAPL